MLTSLFRVAVGLPLAVLGIALTTARDPAAEPSPEPNKEHTPVTAIHLDRDGEKWASKTLRKMSTDEKVGQLIMPWARRRNTT